MMHSYKDLTQYLIEKIAYLRNKVNVLKIRTNYFKKLKWFMNTRLIQLKDFKKISDLLTKYRKIKKENTKNLIFIKINHTRKTILIALI